MSVERWTKALQSGAETPEGLRRRLALPAARRRGLQAPGLLQVLGLDRRRPYETRHTCATLWLAAGEAPEWIARQLGHTTTEMLFRVYSRYVPNLTRRDGSAFENLVSGISMASLNETDKGGPSKPKPRKRGSTSNGR